MKPKGDRLSDVKMLLPQLNQNMFATSKLVIVLLLSISCRYRPWKTSTTTSSDRFGHFLYCFHLFIGHDCGRTTRRAHEFLHHFVVVSLKLLSPQVFLIIFFGFSDTLADGGIEQEETSRNSERNNGSRQRDTILGCATATKLENRSYPMVGTIPMGNRAT